MISTNRKSISAGDLKMWMSQDRKFILLDVLPEDYFTQKHIQGAINACVYEVAFIEKVKSAATVNTATIIVYGESSEFLASAAAYTKLIDAGFKDVYELTGGISSWEKNGYTVEGPDSNKTMDYSSLKFHPNKSELAVSSEKSKIFWTGRNLANFHNGHLKLKSGNITLMDGNLAGGQFSIDMQSILCEDLTDKGMNRGLISHLLSADFFEASKFPEASFEISGSELLKNASPGAPNYKISGSLTIKGITNDIEFDCIVGWNTKGLFFAQAAFEIDRTRWNVMYGSGKFFERLGMHLVNDYITIQLFITAG